MRLIGRFLSPFARRVAVSLDLLGLYYEHEPLTAWQNLDEVRRRNPVGRIPALVLDDGEVLVDSAAILDYLDQLVGPERALTPPAGTARREVMRASAVAVGAMEKAGQIRWELNMRPAERVHEPWVAHNRGQLHSALNWLNDKIQGPWAHGERMTQTDVSVVVICEFLVSVEPSLFPSKAYPALEALVARTQDMPAFTRSRPNS